MAIFVVGMLLAVGLWLRAIRSGDLTRQPRDPRRLRETVPPLVLTIACLAIFPWRIRF
jgi:hypothetical protein